MLTVIYGILIISFLALAHEFGHFVAARLSKIPVEEFAIGFGKTIFSKKFKDGMVFKIGVLPILGYVKIKGMEDNFDAEDGFYNRSALQKIFTISAGVLMNIIVAILIFSLVFATFGNPLSPTTTIASVVQGSPAEIAGLKQGDKILEINGVSIDSWEELVQKVQQNKDRTATFVIERNGNKLTFSIAPKFDSTQQKWMIGISPRGEKYPVYRSIIESFKWAFESLFLMFKFIPQLFTRVGISSVSGPIGIIAMTGTAASGGFLSLLFFVAYISIALAFTNLLPVPPLDGSWLVLIIFEAITRKRIPAEKTSRIQSIALMIILGLMFIVSINDILKLFNK